MKLLALSLHSGVPLLLIVRLRLYENVSSYTLVYASTFLYAPRTNSEQNRLTPYGGIGLFSFYEGEMRSYLLFITEDFET